MIALCSLQQFLILSVGLGCFVFPISPRVLSSVIYSHNTCQYGCHDIETDQNGQTLDELRAVF